jgi:tRNA pseudouridine32 synthase/23S rRNA pseudouridine746 synthase
MIVLTHAVFLLLAIKDLTTVFEDDDIIVVDKPSGVLTVAGKEDNPNLAKAVYDIVKTNLPTEDHMVVHRLGMDTSGLIILAKTKRAVRKMNEVFRSRKVERQYEALVAGHVDKDEGLISLPIMRDYEFPPYVRISTDDHQRALLDLDPEVVGKKILEAPKESITKYEVVSREEIDGNPVTRVTLTSISGRYHQLNVHLAAFGHPIVGDTVYGIEGSAASNGGLRDEELDVLAPNPNRACSPLQAAITSVAKDKPACVHAKYLKFRHPISGHTLDFSTDSPF